ncbi:putative sulfate exporter family transporter [Alicyclobacillus tolerans]|uniref:YeiH family protein n=1 Tax=Alicyclobacillus tolerans TaxID=90970 RepID=UPI001F009543|nr:putative sulfate exporter family transporter [Alicyclobacillus tolerans]MCF8566376.1 putative sulfate exporter family transporter [Alicyclobacillus tolerans]
MQPQPGIALSRWRKSMGFTGGVLFTFTIALLGMGLTKFPVFDRFGAMVSAILLAVAYRQVAGYPEQLRTGVAFSAKKLLRYAIVLYGFKLNVDVILHRGLPLLLRDAGTIVLALGLTMLIAKWLKADKSLSLLLGVGTGVCGAAAVAAVSPIVKAKDEDTALGAGMIALMGTFFTMVYTLLRPILPLSASQYGIWAGISLHEIAHVAAAAAPAGQTALTLALLAKLGRVLLLVPLSFILMYWMKKKGVDETGGKVEFPWFLLGFVATSLMGTYLKVPQGIVNELTSIGTFLLASAMVGLGLNVSFASLKHRAAKPLLAMFLTSTVLSLVTFFTVL